MSSPSSRSRQSPGSRLNPDALEWLKRHRERVQARRARARETEKAITSGVKRFVAAWVAIAECESRRDSAIEALSQQIMLLRERADDELRGYRADQAAAVASIRERGQSDDEVAELLEITPKEVRRLTNESRSAAAESSALDSRNAETADEASRTGREVGRTPSDHAETEQEPGRPT